MLERALVKDVTSGGVFVVQFYAGDQPASDESEFALISDSLAWQEYQDREGDFLPDLDLFDFELDFDGHECWPGDYRFLGFQNQGEPFVRW